MPRFALPLLVVALLAGGLVLIPSGRPASAAGSLGVPLADPDTVRATDGKYVTYGTKVASATCGSTKKITLNVPYVISSSTSSPAGTCITGDALPGGPGSWTVAGTPVWAPGVIRIKKHWTMFFAAEGKIKKHPHYHEMCVGMAVSSKVRGPFVRPRKVFCSAKSGARWSIDPYPIKSGGRLYLVFRNDGAVKGTESAISVVRLTLGGTIVKHTTRGLFTSKQITWDTAGLPSGSVQTVENPALVHDGWDHHWYLFYSGNAYAGPNYGEGVADCGTELFPLKVRKKGAKKPPHCKPLDVRQAYFGYSKAAAKPLRTMPGDHPGPGGMDIFLDSSGHPRVTWHWWNAANSLRYTAWGRLVDTGAGWVVQ